MLQQEREKRNQLIRQQQFQREKIRNQVDKKRREDYQRFDKKHDKNSMMNYLQSQSFSSVMFEL